MDSSEMSPGQFKAHLRSMIEKGQLTQKQADNAFEHRRQEKIEMIAEKLAYQEQEGYSYWEVRWGEDEDIRYKRFGGEKEKAMDFAKNLKNNPAVDRGEAFLVKISVLHYDV